MALINELRKDFDRHGRQLTEPAFWLLATYRLGRWGDSLPTKRRWLMGKVYGLMKLGTETTTNSRLHRETEIGDDFHIVHAGAIFIDPRAKIGDRVGIMHDVVIGTNMDREGWPVIEDDVFIGAGARVLGGVTIGKGARVAANSVVINDVPAGATAIGVPARVMRYTGRKDKTMDTPQSVVARAQGAKMHSPKSESPALETA